jgi:hypothetical protein
MAKKRLMRTGLGVALVVLGVLIAAFNVINLSEAFGSGPPYYGRMTNMDKWSNPVPALAAVDALGVLLVAAYFYFPQRKG